MFNMNNMMGNMNMNMNMNPMGMNNQLMTNLAMDDTALKIKSIIDPYEKKISELEKIIKQKDFEILVLKEKLNKYKNNMNNNMNMANQMSMNNNVNWMDFYNNKINGMNLGLPNLNDNQNIINLPLPNMNLIFNYKGKDYNEQCNFDEKTKIVCGRFCRRLEINYKNYNFIWNSKRINCKILSQMTIAQVGILDNSKISVNAKPKDNSEDEETDSDGECECEGEKFTVFFKGTAGRSITININPEHSIKTLLRKYLFKIGKINEFGKNNLVFLFNARKLYFNDESKIKDWLSSNCQVSVNPIYNITGGYNDNN